MTVRNLSPGFWTAISLAGSIFLAISGCSAAQAPSSPARTEVFPSSNREDRTVGERVASSAREQIGRPYRYGGTSPATGFDCSGLAWYVHTANGITIPRTSGAQRRTAQPVGLANLQPGDLLFFRIAGKLGHVGIYDRDGRFIHAPSSGKTVVMGSLDNLYWRERLLFAGRFHETTARSR